MVYLLGGGVELDIASVELRVEGEIVAVEPQVFDVLAHLVTNPDRVVTKEELLDTIWGDRFVSESALTSRIKSARRAVGDDGRAQRMIRTMHGRGYRWVGPVSSSDDRSVHAPGAGTSGHHSEGASGEPSAGEASSWPLVGRENELALIAAGVHGGRTGGVLITGPAGLGKTKLAEEAVARLAAPEVSIATVRAHTEARSVPLACLSHLLPITVTDSIGPDGDLSRGRLLRNAISGMEARADGGSLVLFVDDVDHADDLSLAVVAALAQSPTVFLVMTQRVTDTTTPVAFEQLMGDQTIERLELTPVRDDHLASALRRSLGAPVEPTCLGQLLSAAAGRPGVLRQLVENSIHRGGLRLENGVWSLAGELSPPADLADLIDERLTDLEDEHRETAELLALAGSIDLDVATDLAGEEALDALDLRGLLAVTDEGRAEVRLAHPLYAEALLARLTPLRARRLRLRLATALGQDDDSPARGADRLRVVRWRLDGGEVVHPDDLLDTARLAVLHKDHDTARELIARLQREAPSAAVDQLDAEVRFRQGSPDEVERLLGGIDLDELEPEQRSQVVRRRTMNLLYGLMEDDLPFEILDSEIERATGVARVALRAHRLALRVMRGDVRSSLVDGEALLDESEGQIKLEVTRSVAFALWAVGRSADALEMVSTANDIASATGPSLSRPGLALSQMTEIFSLIGLGRMDDARRAADRIGVAVPFGWLPMATSRVAIYEGRPAHAAELMANPLAFAEALGQDFVVAWMRATLAEIERLRGNSSVAAELAALAAPFVEDRGRTVDLDMMMLLAPIKSDLGEPEAAQVDLLAAAGRAAALGFVPGVIQSLHAAAQLGAAEEAADRLTEYAPALMGRGHELQAHEVAARADRDADRLIEVADEFGGLGFVLLSARAYRGAAEVGTGSVAKRADRRCLEVMEACPELVRL